MIRKTPILAIDADGVLLDYSDAYRHAWARAFGELPALNNPNAYWPQERWGVRQLVGDELTHFRNQFDTQFWLSIPAVTGAVDACNRLHEAGFELVCVTALAPQFADARQLNLLSLGFPIYRVIATDKDVIDVSPKAQALFELQPMAFIDDYAPYFSGVPEFIHKALIDRDQDGSPNNISGERHYDSTHCNLNEFADYWITQ